MTSTRVLLEGEAVHVPAWVNDLDSFRRWTDDDAFPESGRISFLLGEVWIDMSKEQLFSHNDVKSEINTVLRTLVKAGRLGSYFTDGVYLILEVVSRSSVEKDTEVLRQAYARAAIREHWLVDARGQSLQFDVLRLARGSYSAVRKRAGWVRSDVFDRWFRLARQDGPDGYPEYNLDVRADKSA